MKPIKFALLSILTLGCTAGGLNLDFDVTPTGELNTEDLHIYLQPINSDANAPELSRTEKGTYTTSLEPDPSGIYYLYATLPDVQMSVPVYIVPKHNKEKIKLSKGANYALITSLNDAPNKALSAFAEKTIDKARTIGTRLSELSDGQVKSLLSSYTSDADSIIAIKKLPQPVQDYIRMWAYTAANDANSLAEHLAHHAGRKLNFSTEDILPAAASVLDNPMATAFQSAPLTIMKSIPRGPLSARMASLYSMYKTPEVRDMVTPLLVNSFLDTFDYCNNFEDGDRELQAVISQYELPSSYLDTFRSRSASIPGAAFPEVKLVDKDGNTVDFSSFKGKYVYVDLWASWCGPCCQEVPYLQALEKELDGGDVVFVSISTDSKKEPWLKKMTQLEMHGNQLWNSDGELAKKLNVKGIPHFLLYNPDGTLNTYNMSRPSAPETKLKLQSLKK